MNQFECRSFQELSKRRLYDIMKLRQEVFVLEQSCMYLDADGLDMPAHHLFQYDKDKKQLSAYARLLPKGIAYEDYSSFGRVLVPKEYRKTGLGIKLVQECIEACKKLYDNEPVQIGAQVYLKDFYEGFGFEAKGDIYLDAGIEHVHMVIK